MEILGIDIGGSGTKAAVVDGDSGRLVTPRVRVPTPDPSTPKAVAKAAADLVRELSPGSPVGIGFPAVIVNGVAKTAANIDEGWIGTDAGSLFGEALGRPVVMGNDADAAGLAEMRFGAGRGEHGTVLLLTLGTGIGSALFRDGVLVPNTELGHLELRGKAAERRAAVSVKERKDLSWDEWSKVLSEYLELVERLLWPDLIILGGGVSKESEKFIGDLPDHLRIVAAELRNEAGIVGAALLAAEAPLARPIGAAKVG